MKKIYILFLAATLIAFSATGILRAYSFINRGYGDSILSVDARSMAIGNTGVASSYGASSIFYNPANMIKTGGTSLSFTAGIRPFKEKIEESSGNVYYNSQLNYALPDMSFLLPLGGKFRFGIGRFPVRDLNYEYERDIYSGGSLTEQYSYVQDGSISAITPAVALMITNSFSFGLGINMLSGGADLKDLYIMVDSTKTLIESDLSASGTSFDIGVNWKPSTTLSFGFKITPEYTVDLEGSEISEIFSWNDKSWTSSGKTETDSTVEVSYPQTMAFGVNYEFWEREMSVFSLDIIKTSWESFRYKETKDSSDPNYNKSLDPDFYDTVQIRAGVEHSLNVSTLLRCNPLLYLQL
ncbi:MAG: outer membrane protein transport protein [Elusimicrobia bacterium]|nr:outer membrane protein transport protein [Elusimicrobiota bacterium]